MSIAGEPSVSAVGEEDVRAHLEVLRATGAHAFDQPAFDFIVTLLDRAEALARQSGGAPRSRWEEGQLPSKPSGLREGRALSPPVADRAAAKLRDRARVRALELEKALLDGRGRAEAALSRFEGLRLALAARLAEGTVVEVLRAAKREEARSARPKPVDTARVARLRVEAARRGVRLRGDEVAEALRSESDEARLLAMALYDASRSQAEAAMTAHSAAADLPVDPGPYNPLALAVGVLAELSALSPSYLTALVGQLSELGALLALPPVASASARAVPAPRRARKTRK